MLELNTNLELIQINFDEYESIFLIDFNVCSLLFAQVSQPHLSCKMIHTAQKF